MKYITRTYGPPPVPDRSGPVPRLNIADKTIYETFVDTEHAYHIGPGHFGHGEELVDEINEKKPQSFRCRFHIHKNTKKCTIFIQAGQKLVLHPLLARMLGFVENEFEAFDKSNAITSRSIVSPTSGFEYILVYTDIVKDSVVGTTEAPLLRTVPASRRWDEQVSHIFDSPHYVPVALSRIPRIEIKIASETGNLVPFEQGKTLIKLHFRKKSPFSL